MVIDTDGITGHVVDCTDPHNVQVSYIPRGCITGGIGIYCIVEKCREYNPLYILKKKE
jgi:hypothetical protein